jgi:hypothetical protein
MRLRLFLALPILVLATFALAQTAPRAGKLDSPHPGVNTFGSPFLSQIKPLLVKYCTRCHGGRRPKGDIRLDAFSDEAAALKEHDVWERVAANLRSGDMPPAGKPRPTPAEMDLILGWIDRAVLAVDCGKERNPGRVTLRRLNRAEYNNTIRDLVGIRFRPADDFPSDDVGYGFDNIGDVLSLSPLLLEKYLAAAEKIVDLAFKDEQARRRILIASPEKVGKKEAARLILREFARRAYRRPVHPGEVERLMRFVDLAQKNGESFEKGIRLALQAVLVSPHFLFRIERDPPPGRVGVVNSRMGNVNGHYINDYELASRLSYFLWSSMPDEELFRLAEQKALRKGDNLERQVKRMLADPKAQALVDNFFGQWLQFRNLPTATPDPGVYPAFDEELRAAMLKETQLFVGAIIKEDRSILDFLDADFSFVNERLARHYGIAGVKGPEFRRVKLPPTRGGILGQASILTITSNPTRTSPVKRGKWVLETIFNAPPPPPPPEAGQLNEDKQAVLSGSLRKRMELHRAKPMCAACHQRMDPLGFGLENFDGIGGWRDKDGQFPIDASGTLPGGQTFNGPKELRQILVKKQAEFRRCLAEKMLTYALGRGLEPYDRCAVEAITKAVAQHDNRFSSLVLAVVQSEPFLMRGTVTNAAGGRRQPADKRDLPAG